MSSCSATQLLLHRPHARGAAYVAVLGACLLVAVIGFSALSAARVQLQSSELEGHILAARAYARSGSEYARLIMAQDPNWRRSRPHGVWFDRMPIQRGAFTVTVTDPVDNDLANWPIDPVVLTVSGYSGAAEQMESVILVPQIIPMGCLEVAAISGGSFTINNGTLVCDQTVASNSSFNSAGSSQIDSRVEAVGSINGTGYMGMTVSGVPARAIPASAAAIDDYLASATPISYNDLSGGTIQDVLLSPQNNPYGPTNPLGIYVVDCSGRSFGIRNSRIVGTLIVLDPRSDSRIRDSVHIAPAVANFPTLLIRGSMNFEFSTDDLLEGSGRNFNPPGTPYNGVSNETTLDQYPSRIEGLVYLSGSATLNSCGTIRGVLISRGPINGTGRLDLRYDGSYLQNPPPGFCQTPNMLVQPGTVRRVVR